MVDYNKYKDEDLMELLNSQSPVCDQAFAALFQRYSEQINAYCLFKASNISDAEEIFQDTWIRFFNAVKTGKRPDVIIAYLYKTARNLSIDRFRYNKSLQFINNEMINFEQIAAPFNLNHQIEENDLINLISIAVNNLEEIYKETFVMQWFGGLTQQEIADVLGETIGCIKMRSHRAMSELIKILKPHLIETN